MPIKSSKVARCVVLTAALSVGTVFAQAPPDFKLPPFKVKPSIERNQIRLTGKNVARGAQMRWALNWISRDGGGLTDSDRQITKSFYGKGPDLSQPLKTLRVDLCDEIKRQDLNNTPDAVALAEKVAQGEREEYEALAAYYEHLVSLLSTEAQQAFASALDNVTDSDVRTVGTHWVGLAIEDPDFVVSSLRNSCTRSYDAGPARDPIQVIDPNSLVK